MTLLEYSGNTKGTFRASAFQFRPYHGTELYNKIGQKVKYSHNNELNNLEGRSQFNFTAGNFGEYSDNLLNKLVFETNKLNDLDCKKRKRKRL